MAIRLAAVLLVGALACAAELPLVRVALRPASAVAAPQARLAEVADLSGDPAGVAELGEVPVLTLFGAGVFRLDERRVRAALGRRAAPWRLEVSGVGQVSVPSRRFAADELVVAARAAIEPAGDELEIGLVRPLADLVVPDLGGGVRLVADAVDRTLVSGEIPVRVRVLLGDAELGRALVPLAVGRFRTLAVAAAPIARGQLIAAADVRSERVRVSQRHLDSLGDPAQAIGRLATRDLREGDHLPRWSVATPPDVRAGSPVTLVWRGDGIELTASGESMTTARLGERIHVRRADGQVVKAQVIGEGVALLER